MHFCPGLPIILVGCKFDLRHDPKIIEELGKAGQRPTTPEEVCLYSALLNDSAFILESIDTLYLLGYSCRFEDRRQAIPRVFR